MVGGGSCALRAITYGTNASDLMRSQRRARILSDAFTSCTSEVSSR